MQLHHICILTNVYEASLAFWRDVMGMEVLKVNADFNGRDYNTWLGGRGLMIELMTPKRGKTFNELDPDAQGLAHICFQTDALDAEYERVTSLGVSIQKELYSVLGSRLFKVTAPEGTIVEFRDNPGY